MKLVLRMILMLMVMFVMFEGVKERKKNLADYGIFFMQLVVLFVFAFYEF